MLNKDFKEFIKLLNSNNVKYLVVGGYALALHGHPRYTKDIDIWVQSDLENAQKLLKSLHSFGFSELDLIEEDFLKPGNVIQLGYPPSRIDLLTQATGVNFEECYLKKIELKLEDVVINFIDLENLIKNKKATGRLQDLADIEKLQ